ISTSTMTKFFYPLTLINHLNRWISILQLLLIHTIFLLLFAGRVLCTCPEIDAQLENDDLLSKKRVRTTFFRVWLTLDGLLASSWL
ncbi:hypothetical protein HN51_004161, partial [Arachis hypogaea]